MHVVPLAECSMMTTFRRELLLSCRTSRRWNPLYVCLL